MEQLQAQQSTQHGAPLLYFAPSSSGCLPQSPSMQQQQQHATFVAASSAGQQHMILQGKPMGEGSLMYQGHPGVPSHSMPQRVALPGGTYIQPHAFTHVSNGMPIMWSGQPIPTGAPYAVPVIAPLGVPLPAVAIKQEEKPSSSHSANTSGGFGSGGSPLVNGSGTPNSSGGSAGGGNKSRYRGVSYDRKKAKWRVQIKVAALGKSGVSVGYFDTEEAAARAYDRAAIGLLGRDNPNLQTNFDLTDYAEEPIPPLTGKSREEVKTTLKSERIKQAPRRRFTSRQRTSRFMGVGSSNRKNQWQARILVHGKVTHLGYYETEEEAAKVYDRVSLALHGGSAQTNFPCTNYGHEEVDLYRGLDREDLQRALGVKPMDKSSRYRGVSKKKGKWEAKVMVNRRWAYRELFDSEEEAARAYDRALWRLKPREARSYVNFKNEVPADMEALVAAADAAGGYRGVASDGDLADSANEGGGFDDDDAESDGGDFEYGYRPSKGTARSASMKAKRNQSAPNLAAMAAAAAATNSGAKSAVPSPSGPAFMSLPGGGLQLQLGGPSAAPPPGMVPVHHSGEPLLIRVGSETHFLPSNGPGTGAQTLGKRTGLQRIQSEPQFYVSGRPTHIGHGANLATIAGVDAGDIQNLMDDHDLFRGLDLADLGAAHTGHAGSAVAGTGVDLSHFPEIDFMQTGTGGEGFAGLMFEEDEELVAQLEFNSRPRKMSKSVSMVNLSSLGQASDGGRGASPIDLGKPPLPSGGGSSPPTSQGSQGDGDRLGPLGQPIRRTNTYTKSLATFEEAEEKPHMIHHTSGDDLVHHFMGAGLDTGLNPMPSPLSVDDAFRMLGAG